MRPVSAGIRYHKFGARASHGRELGGTHPQHSDGFEASSLREKLAAGLRSTGGRPALEGADRKQKIPMADADWATVGQLARAFQADGVHATPGQVAAQLLHDAIARVGPGAAYPDESTRPRRALPLAETVVAGRRGTAVTRIDLADAALELRTASPGSPAPATAVT